MNWFIYSKNHISIILQNKIIKHDELLLMKNLTIAIDLRKELMQQITTELSRFDLGRVIIMELDDLVL